VRKGALAAERILVNAVAPGACATGFTKGLPSPATRTAARPARKALHGGRTTANHLRVLAASNGLPDSRVDEVLRIVGLRDVAARRACGFWVRTSMSAITGLRPTSPGRLTPPLATFSHVLSSERIKLTTTRSTWITLLVALVIGIGVGVR
jgi:NAD(P)-dependent dehydrogenase (short-subunit alcohol dehydrogenase family)